MNENKETISGNVTIVNGWIDFEIFLLILGH